jgi:hypothetical protein
MSWSASTILFCVECRRGKLMDKKSVIIVRIHALT